MDEPEFQYLWGKRYQIMVRALTNRIYYQERQRIFEWRDGLIKAASILAGSVAFANVTNPDVVKYSAAFITAASTFSLVFGYGNKARDSVKRSSEWTQLERDIEAAGERDFTEQQLNEWSARANEIESGEPAMHETLFNRCHARAINALGSKDDSGLTFWDKYAPVILIP
mgnify:CR=1 FL=1